MSRTVLNGDKPGARRLDNKINGANFLRGHKNKNKEIYSLRKFLKKSKAQFMSSTHKNPKT